MTTLNLPSTDSRTVIVGSTGSGKTQFAVWLLSTRDWFRRPWIIFDYKGDALIAEIGAKEISLTAPLPKKPGIYVIRPLPGDENLASDYFARIWAKEDIGVYIDEGYMVPRLDRYFRACLTQGRSKNIEMIILSQRPVWMDKFVFTEASYFAILRLNVHDDRKHVATFTDGSALTMLPKFHSLWYDVAEQRSQRLSPVPEAQDILARFEIEEENKRYYL